MRVACPRNGECVSNQVSGTPIEAVRQRHFSPYDYNGGYNSPASIPTPTQPNHYRPRGTIVNPRSFPNSPTARPLSKASAALFMQPAHNPLCACRALVLLACPRELQDRPSHRREGLCGHCFGHTTQLGLLNPFSAQQSECCCKPFVCLLTNLTETLSAK